MTAEHWACPACDAEFPLLSFAPVEPERDTMRDHQTELETLETRLSKIEEDAPMWTAEQLAEARASVREARKLHVGMYEWEDGDE